MREAVIISTARTGIGRAFRGAFNHTKSPTLAGHAIAHAVSRDGVDGAEMEDVVLGSVLNAGTAGMNVARYAAIAAGLPASVAGQTMDRQCASSLMAIATAAKQVMVDGMDVVVAGGQENISAVQNDYGKWIAATTNYPYHGQWVCAALGIPPLASALPLMYQGGSDDLLGPQEDMPLPDEDHDIDIEGEFVAVLDDVTMGARSADALKHIRLLMLANDCSLRALQVR
jgi:2-keto-4-pentenoate hydratase/2-oxohepta-3-ene-1,7-dioic acid hydratase in catechol pathway